MITLLTTLASFLAGGLPKILDFFQDKSDKKHELEMAMLQKERELEILAKGYAAQARVEEIRTDQISIQAHAQERQSLYQHDIEIGKGASQWIINLRASVRPVITYGLFLLLVLIDVFGLYYAISTGVQFVDAMNQIWDDDAQLIWASVVAFWFGSQAFSKR
ncbi:MAG TPA: hypothetical protein DEP47_05520 [Chloroflexi bacterium]|nr:hypothetical protein [Chloroflexota bacterium]